MDVNTELFQEVLARLKCSEQELFEKAEAWKHGCRSPSAARIAYNDWVSLQRSVFPDHVLGFAV